MLIMAIKVSAIRVRIVNILLLGLFSEDKAILVTPGFGQSNREREIIAILIPFTNISKTRENYHTYSNMNYKQVAKLSLRPFLRHGCR